jgi:hypothetical protein
MVGDGASSVAVPGKVFDPKNYETKLYHALPFRFVPTASDLTGTAREQYRLRKIINVDDREYVGYFAKKFEPGSLYLQYNEVDYLPNENHTVPVDENDSRHELLGGVVFCYIQFTLPIEPVEIKEYFQVINGSLELSSISEAGIVYGADLDNALTVSENKKELAAAELFSKVTSKPFYLDNEGSARDIVYKIYAK